MNVSSSLYTHCLWWLYTYLPWGPLCTASFIYFLYFTRQCFYLLFSSSLNMPKLLCGHKCVISSLGYISRSGVVGLYHNTVFNFLIICEWGRENEWQGWGWDKHTERQPEREIFIDFHLAGSFSKYLWQPQLWSGWCWDPWVSSWFLTKVSWILFERSLLQEAAVRSWSQAMCSDTLLCNTEC